MPIKIDLVDGGDYSYRVERTAIRETATRMAIVSGLSTDTAPAKALIQARSIVQAAYPLATPYDVTHAPLCVLVGYQSLGLSQDDDAVRVRISYERQPIEAISGSPGTPIWTIEDNGEEEAVQTQRDPTGEILYVSWVNPDDPKHRINRVTTITGYLNVRRVILSGILTSEQRDFYGSMQGRVNDFEFMGLPRGYWKYRSLRTHTIVGASFWWATVELVTKQTEDWSVYATVVDPILGEYIKIPPGEMRDLVASEYILGIRPINGAIKVGQNHLVDFNTLFTIQQS